MWVCWATADDFRMFLDGLQIEDPLRNAHGMCLQDGSKKGA